MSWWAYHPACATPSQVAEAAKLRYGPGSEGMPRDVRQGLHQIVHHQDAVGPFSKTPNSFRDMPGIFDPRAEAVLQQARSYGR